MIAVEMTAEEMTVESVMTTERSAVLDLALVPESK